MNESTFFYKYRSIDDENTNYSRRIFTTNELYFSNPHQFNDPFDCKVFISFDSDLKALKDYFSRTMQNRPGWNRHKRRNWLAKFDPEILESAEFKSGVTTSHEQLMSEIGICSLCKNPTNILMWSHYAKSHTGFCIKLLDAPRDRFIARALPVHYSDSYPIMYPATDSYEVRLRKTLLTKAQNWSYEEEWRIIDHEVGPGVQQFPPHLLVAVIFGCRMSDAHKQLIRTWCSERTSKVDFYQAHVEPDLYALRIERA